MTNQNPKLFRQRMEKARKWAKIIGQNPFVVMVALTGSLAEGKIRRDSDIDFFIQIAPNKIWSTRFWITLRLWLKGEYRQGRMTTGKICPNWWATFNAPQKVGRRHQVLYQNNQKKKVLKPNLSEKLLKFLQVQRIIHDPRTHQPGSQVRCSDQEIGFHPLKKKQPDS